MSELNITTKETLEDQYIISLHGKLDTATYAKLEQLAQQLFISPVRVITLNLKDLDYISSMGLRVIMELEKHLRANKGELLITNASPSIAEVLEIAKALPSMNIFSSIAEADAYLSNFQKKA